MTEQDKSGKKTNGFSIPIKEVSKIGSEFLKTVGKFGDIAKEKERTKQAQHDADARIRASDNELEKAKLNSQREYERNYLEMMRILAEHEKGCKDTHVHGMIEVIHKYADIVMDDQNETIKNRCLDTMDRLSLRIESIGDDALTRSTANWLNSIRKLPEA